MTEAERRVLRAIADQGVLSVDGTVNPQQLKKVVSMSAEALNLTVLRLQKLELVEIDDDAGTVSISDAGREALGTSTNG